MVKGQPIRDWRKQFEMWRTSGKSVAAWSREQNIPKTTIYSWKQKATLEKNLQKEKKFIELQDKDSASSLTLECEGCKIHLTENFNEVLLKRCLAVLRGCSC